MDCGVTQEVYCTDVVYICNDFKPSGNTHDDEVIEVKWFPITALPKDISTSVKDVIEKFAVEHINCKPQKTLL